MKFVMVGASSCGKTSIIKRFKDDVFYEFSESTIGALYLQNTVEVDGQTMAFELWDTAGQETYKSLTPLYLRNFRVAIITFDVTSKQSLEEAKYWIKEILLTPESKRSDTLIALCGNMVDKSGFREVPPQRTLAKQYGLLYYETSAKTGQGVREMFTTLYEKCPKSERSNSEEDDEDEWRDRNFISGHDMQVAGRRVAPATRRSWCSGCKS
mmetsp:Transcript_717/g.2395  ORF Transcript_717/g.2395 Transcript_717/m.2395 type:complete len:211 (-) Transcript_717:1111-1743(-)